jgi:hypothetical protein
MFPKSSPFHITFFICPTIFTSFFACCAVETQPVNINTEIPNNIVVNLTLFTFFLNNLNELAFINCRLPYELPSALADNKAITTQPPALAEDKKLSICAFVFML